MFKAQTIARCLGLTLAALLATSGPLRAVDDPAAVDPAELQLIAVLESDAPPAEKAITCKHLAVHGSKHAVPALGRLLADPELASWARIALEVIPDPSADEVLRQSLDTLDGRLLVGALNSIGVRRDAAAVGALAPFLTNDDLRVASSAAIALGRIGSGEAAAALQQALASSQEAVRAEVAEGCVLCAERLLAEGKATEAAQLYEKVRQADVPKQRILEATRGAILALGPDGIRLLAEQLDGDDAALFAMALRTSRELPAGEVTQALIAQLAKATPDRQIPLLSALSQRGDDAVLPVILQTAKGGNSQVRAAAVAVLGRIGDVSCVPTLLELATDTDVELAQAAKGALEGLSGSEVDHDLAGRLPAATGQLRRVLIELVGLRRIDAVATLIAAADDADPQVRAAALAALGATVGPQDLGVLIARVAAPTHREDATAASQALLSACTRMPDRDACAEQLASAMRGAPLAAQNVLLETIGAVGGTAALEAVAKAAAGDEVDLQDTASQLLGRWMTADAAPVLLSLAKSLDDEKFRVRAMRGYIRITRQFTFPIEDRAAMCRSALQAAQRDAERRLVLEVLEQNPGVETLEVAVDAARFPSLKNDVARVALLIAQKASGQAADVRALLGRVGITPVKLEIVKAEYGADGAFRDVTETLRKQAGDLPLVTLPGRSYNASFGGDPAPGTRKQLKVSYRIDGKAGEATFAENETIMLPIP